MSTTTLKALLKSSGASLTKPRKQIFNLLYSQPPQSMQVLVKRASDTTDRATVYRTIELFERLGIVQRINAGWKYKIELTDVFTGHHHHFHCTNCSKLISLKPNPMLETMIDSTTAKEGHSPRGHQLEIHGLCTSCV